MLQRLPSRSSPCSWSRGKDAGLRFPFCPQHGPSGATAWASASWADGERLGVGGAHRGVGGGGPLEAATPESGREEAPARPEGRPPSPRPAPGRPRRAGGANDAGSLAGAWEGRPAPPAAPAGSAANHLRGPARPALPAPRPSGGGLGEEGAPAPGVPAPLPGRPAAHGGAGSNLGRNGSGAEAIAPRGPVPAAASLPAPPAGLIAESGLIGNANGN